jgi:hypothetical protein
MTPSEIIQKNSQKFGYDADMLLRKISKIVKAGGGILLQENNSLLLMIAIEPNVVEIHLFTVDSPLNFEKSIKTFIEKIKSSDIQKVYSSYSAPEVVNMLDENGLNVEKSDKPNYSWMADVS